MASIDDTSRRRVVDAVLELVANDGLDAVTFSATAAAAGASRGLVQHLFGTREALLRAAAVRLRERVDERVDLRPGHTPRQRLSAVLDAFVPSTEQAVDDAFAATGLMVLVRRDPELRATWRKGRDLVRSAVAQALRDAGSPDASSTAAALIGQAAELGQDVLLGELTTRTARRRLAAAVLRATAPGAVDASSRCADPVRGR